MENKFKIDKGVKVVACNPHLGEVCPFPIAEMEVGDSFAIPDSELSSISFVWHWLNKEIKANKTRNNRLKKFITRHTLENGVYYRRVWRSR